MLLNYFLGRTLLWHGQPFLARTWFDRTASDFTGTFEPDPGHLIPDVTFKPAERGNRETAVEPLLSTISRLPVGIVGIDTNVLAPGCYEVTVRRGGQSLIVPELVWVLTKEDYSAFVKDELSEEPAEEPVVGGQEELSQYLDVIKRTRWPESVLDFQLIYRATVPFSFGRIEAMVSVVMDVFRYLSIFGFKTGARATISVGNETFELGIEIPLELLLPQEVREGLHNPECSDFVLLRAARPENESFDFDISVENQKARIRIQHSMPQLAYAG